VARVVVVATAVVATAVVAATVVVSAATFLPAVALAFSALFGELERVFNTARPREDVWVVWIPVSATKDRNVTSSASAAPHG